MKQLSVSPQSTVNSKHTKTQREPLLTISPKHIEQLKQHAISSEPNESCAILFCHGDAVHDIRLAENTLESPIRFEISPEELKAAYNIAETRGFDTVAIFHSHPNGIAYPSKTDEQFMRINPVPWIIYSGNTREIKAFVLESNISEIPLIIK